MSNETRAVVLSGGGLKGAFQVGAMFSLCAQPGTGEDRLPWTIYAGTSTGALQAAGASGGYLSDLIRLRDVWFKLRGPNDIYTKRRFGWLRVLGKRSESLYDAAPLRGLINAAFSPHRAIGAGSTLLVSTVNLRDGQAMLTGERHPNIKKMVLASASMPVFFPGVRQGADLYVDGGVRNITPLKAAIDAGATQIDVILCSPLRPERAKGQLKSFMAIGMRTLAILENEVYLGDLREALRRNRALGATDRILKINVIAPTEDLGETLAVDRSSIRAAYKLGKAAKGVPLESLNLE